jgi:metal-sulfur cluster biosynthetic enzyme
MEEGQPQAALEDQIREALRSVLDPEIGLSVVDLGFIKEIRTDTDPIRISMVLSAPFCPMAGMIVEQVRLAAESAAGGRKAEVEVLHEPWRPPWLDDMPA